MSYPYSSYYEHPSAPRLAPQAPPRPRANQAGYTLAHGGRQLRIGPVTFWIVVGTLVVMGVWSLATGTYFAFKDSVLARLISRQAEIQFAYEDRIAELRAQVDRITSRQMLDQEQVEQKLAELLRRQSTLEQRTSTLSGNDAITTGSVRSGRGAKPSPLNENGEPEKRSFFDFGTRSAKAVGSIDVMLTRVAGSLDRVETKQQNALNTMEETVDAKARTMRGVLADLGVDPGRTPSTGGVGGPFQPLKQPRANADNFERQLYRINLSRAQADRYAQTLLTVPVRKPVFGDIDMSSPFGTRMDPFVRGPAIHSGIDMRGDTGDPVRATAAGTVVTAGVNGGYGKMVEIEHEHNLSTRYGHLSAIDVQVGQKVKVGQIIGKIGSTGRSTGPHLHYETRVNDEAVNPQRFLNAGSKLGLANN